MFRLIVILVIGSLLLISFAGCVEETTAPIDENGNNNNGGNDNDDDDDNDNDPDPQPETRDFYLEAYNVNTSPPSYVNVFFQVASRENNQGVSDLTTEDFRVLENGELISRYESNLQIGKSDDVQYALKVVLMLDNSFSVGNNLSQIKSSAINMIDQASGPQLFAVYSFSEYPSLIQDFTTNKEALRNAIRSIPLGAPTTDFYGAVIEGASHYEDIYSVTRIEQGFLVIMTDGRDTQFSHTLDEAREAIENKNVYTIGVGPEIDVDVLEMIGTKGFYYINDFTDLELTFEEILHDLELYSNSFYWLHYLSPTRGYREHTLDIEVYDNTNIQENAAVHVSFFSTLFYTDTNSGNPLNSRPLFVFDDPADSLYGITLHGPDLTLSGAAHPEYDVKFRFIGSTDSIFFASLDDDECVRHYARNYPEDYIAYIRGGDRNNVYSVRSRGKFGLLYIHDWNIAGRSVRIGLKIQR